MFVPLPAIRDDEETASSLISILNAALTQKKSEKNPKFPFFVRKKEWTIHASSGPTVIDNWKFNEYDFSDPTIELPCRARGLFTFENTIVARGYDKFFNQEEVQDTKLDKLKQLQGPFSVSTKENGCIIFLSGLEDGTLLVCSKNSTGEALKDGEMVLTKHVKGGNLLILQQLAKAGKTSQQLAKVLYELNVTAVTELCDDEFEEHVVEYPKELAGLYLHGLNFNTRKFQTYPMDRVKRFAAEWGFLQVSDLSFPTFDTLWQFLDARARTGTFEGREIEGFVVRAKRCGSDFFFKYKFSEPYYLYRQLREATMKLIDKEYPQTIRQIVLRLPKQQAAIVNKYLEFVSEVFEAQPELKDQYLESSGIIRLRKMFLAHMGYSESDGLKLIANAATDEKLSQKLNNLIEATTFHYALVPIASIGCGKTTTFKILTTLMPQWGHVQSDDYFKKALKFQEKCLRELDSRQVVMIDRNHHKSVVRSDLFRSFSHHESSFVMPSILIRYVGLNFMSKGMSDDNLKFLQNRLIRRGDNHQTLRVKQEGDSMSRMAKGFYETFTAPTLRNPIDHELPVSIQGSEYKHPDDGFSTIINLDCTEEDSSLRNAKTVLHELAKIYPDIEIPQFSEEQWLAAFEEAKAYKPEIVYKQNVQKRPGKPIYVGIDVERAAIYEIAERYLREEETWNNLVSNDRVQKRFHVTFIHCAAGQNPATKGKWEEAGRKFQLKANAKSVKKERFQLQFFYDVHIQKVVVVVGKLIALQVSLGQFYTRKGTEIVPDTDEVLPGNKVMHITVGTLDQLIAPFKSNIFLEKLVEEYPETPDGEYTVGEQKYLVWNVESKLQKRPEQQMFTLYQL